MPDFPICTGGSLQRSSPFHRIAIVWSPWLWTHCQSYCVSLVVDTCSCCRVCPWLWTNIRDCQFVDPWLWINPMWNNCEDTSPLLLHNLLLLRMYHRCRGDLEGYPAASLYSVAEPIAVPLPARPLIVLVPSCVHCALSQGLVWWCMLLPSASERSWACTPCQLEGWVISLCSYPWLLLRLTYMPAARCRGM